MKEVKKITVPESLQDVTTEQLVKFLKVSEADEVAIMLKAFEVFCDIPKNMVRAMSRDDATYIYETIAEALTVTGELRRTFELGGVEYGMIPNLDKISFGEFIDLDGFITPAFENEIKHEDAFKFLSVLYRPITSRVNDNYKIEEYTGDPNWEVMKQAPADVYLNSVAFFLNLRIELLKASQVYINLLMEEAEAQEVISKSNGAGTEALMHLQTVISSLKTKSPNDLFYLASLNLPTVRKIDYWLN